MRKDDSGDMRQLAIAGGGAWAFGASNAWNVVGWVTIGALSARIVYKAYKLHKVSKAKTKAKVKPKAKAKYKLECRIGYRVKCKSKKKSIRKSKEGW